MSFQTNVLTYSFNRSFTVLFRYRLHIIFKYLVKDYHFSNNFNVLLFTPNTLKKKGLHYLILFYIILIISNFLIFIPNY